MTKTILVGPLIHFPTLTGLLNISSKALHYCHNYVRYLYMEKPRDLQSSIEGSAARAVIPLAFRLVHLGIDVSDSRPSMTTGAIAAELGTDSHSVRRRLIKYGVEPGLPPEANQDANFSYYPAYIIDLLRSEKTWHDWCLTLPNRMNTNQIAEAVGRSYGWTKKNLSELYPNARSQKTGHQSRLYPRVAVQTLRDMTMATPPGENWPTMPRLLEFTGHDRDWVLNRLARTAIRPETRREAVTGRESMGSFKDISAIR